MTRRVLSVLFAGCIIAQIAPAAIAQQAAQAGAADYVREEVKPSAETRGALYRPTKEPTPHVGIVLMHRTADFRNHIATRELARRGFLVLGMNSRFENDEGAVVWENLSLDVKAGVELVKKQPGITKVVLFAHSGGGSIMGCYQALAENGAAYSKGANKITQGTDALAGLPRADGVVFADAHMGIAVLTLRGLNAAVTDEDHPDQLDQGLDPTNPGVQVEDENGDYHFANDFKERYVAGQGNRMERLIERAKEQLAEAKRSGMANPGAEPFEIGGGRGLSPAELFPELLDRSHEPRRFLKNDGSIATQVAIRTLPQASAAAAAGGQRRGGRGGGQARRGARAMTLQSFLTANAVRAANSLDDIDWCSTNCTTPCAAAAISVPVLVTAMGAHTFIRDGEIIFDAAKSKDKEFIVIEGATHNMVPCTACEATPGQFGNVTKNHFDFVAKWINARF
jgi:alpha-beta hydrolase superfamily lysophospholipase